MPDPNGLCFSPDYKKLYVVSTGKGPGDTGPGGKGDIYVFDVGTDNKPTNGKLFTDFMIDGIKCGPDGIRADVYGNLWCVEQCRPQRWATAASPCWSPEGKLLGRIRLPESVRQHRLRRAQAQSAVHGGEPVALRRLRRHAGGRAGLTRFHIETSARS